MTEFAAILKSSLRSLACTAYKRRLNAIDPPVVVLLYHRVATLASDPEMLAVTPDNFHAQMRYLKETVPIVRFEDDWNNISRPAVAITFDDGYADNALEALPILEGIGVPATFFVSTGTISTTKEFWWHELERIILEKQNLPASFTLNDNRLERTWPARTDSERLDFYKRFVQLMNEVDTERRHDWLGQLRGWAGAEIAPATIHRAMTVDELKLLAKSSRVTIGAHTVTHTRLSSLPEDVQREEIVDSKKKLEAWLGREVPVFSYPFGRRSDYSRESIAVCRAAGFVRAAANFPGQAHRWTDPYQVPRHLVRNWPLEVFAEKLRGFWTR